MLRHVHQVDAATDQFAPLEAVVAIAVIASTVDIDGYRRMVGPETESRRQRNRQPLHLPFIDDGIAGIDVGWNPEIGNLL